MKTLHCYLLTIVFVFLSACGKERTHSGKDTGNVLTKPTPLLDFGPATFRGFQGGLYPNGSNQRPAAHQAAGLAIAQSIQPLNHAGAVDPTNGKIVWMSVGMSNTTQETTAFLNQMNTHTSKHPKLTLIDGAQGGQDISKINSPAAEYWNVVDNRLTAAGLTPAQVQIIWYKEAEASPTDTSFVRYPNSLKDKFKSVMQILKSKFPNLRMVYLSDRIYAGYATSNLNPEPYAWYTGWAVKRLIEDQINGDPALNYAGANPVSAWLSWGPYLWANGTTPRSDGLIWVQSDYQSDGTHPGTTGRKKVADMLVQFFSTDETAKPWFLKP